MKIFKYEIALIDLSSDDSINVLIPKHCEIVSVGVQKQHVITLWAIVAVDDKPIERKIYVKGTGHSTPPEPWKFLGSAFDDGFVWHIFEETTK